MAIKRDPVGKFLPGSGGRTKGSRNKLSADFIAALAAEFEEHGDDTIRIVRVESPKDFLKVIAAIIPKELDITDNRLKDIPDDELDILIELARQRLARSGGAGKLDDGKEPATH